MKCRLIPYIQTFLLAVSFTFCSCEDDLLQERDYSSSEYICFDTELIDVFATATTRSHSEHLMMESEDWVIEGKIANTRVAPTTSLSGTAGVIAYKDAAKSPVTEISDVSFTFDNEVLSPSGFPIPWSKVDGASTLHVFSYAPYDVVHGGSAAATINTGTASPTLTFTVPDAVGSQVDLIAASADVLSGSFRTSVPLTYDHVLTAVRFKVDFACKVKSLTINGVNNTGIYTIGGAWGSQSGSQNYTFGSSVFGESGTDVAANAFVTDGANTLMLMPQTVPAGAQVQLEYSEDDGANWTTLTAYINGHEWQKGKRITYTISKTSVNYIYFDLAAGPVTILDGTYTGYIYQKNGAETATITGSHNDANKYYVYQSSTVTGSAGYFTGTGYEETSGTVRIPSYPETMQDSKTWSEYITNNKDLPGVITNWDAAAAGAKRSVTPNYIKICGSSGHVMDVDITLDNVWSSYHKNVSHRSSGGFLIGPGVIETGAQFQDKSRIAYEKVTLRLKGDNHFHNILYWSGTNSSFKITSADGDKSAKGSLTVTFPNTTEELNGACTVFGSGDNDDTPPCTNMSFEGGTIYVGGSVKVKASDST